MASKTLTLNKLVSSDFSEGSSWVLNKGGGGDTDVGYFVFNSIGVPYVKITNVSFKINAIETGGNNLFSENINLDFEFGTYSGSTFTKSSSFSFSRLGVKESENQVSRTATASGSASLSGSNLCIKLTITPQSNSIGSKIVMSGFSLTVTYEVETCTAKFLNWDGTVLETKVVNRGTTPSYTGATPTKNSTSIQEMYQFSGWDKTFSAITSDTTYTAQFKTVPREYEIVVYPQSLSTGEQIEVTGGGIYKYGDTVTLTALNIPQHYHPEWTIRNAAGKVVFSDNTNPYVFVLSGDIASHGAEKGYLITVNVHAIIDSFTVKAEVSPENSGIVKHGYSTDSVVPEEGVTQQFGSGIYFTAVANEGYKFVNWSDGVTDNPRGIYFDANKTYTAIFEIAKINNILADTYQTAMVSIDLSETPGILADTKKVYG